MSFHYEERVIYVLCTLCGTSFEGDPKQALHICDDCRIQAESKDDPTPAS